MNTMAKGTIAGLAGIALLLGGAGTFALWNDTLNPLAGDSVTTGALQFTDDPVTGKWFDGADDQEIDLESVRMVPGDTFYFEGEVSFLAYGKNLDAKLEIDPMQDDLEDWLSFKVTNTDGDELILDGVIDPENEQEQTVEFRAEVTFDFDEQGKDSQQVEVDLSDLTFKLEQLRSPST